MRLCLLPLLFLTSFSKTVWQFKEVDVKIYETPGGIEHSISVKPGDVIEDVVSQFSVFNSESAQTLIANLIRQHEGYQEAERVRAANKRIRDLRYAEFRASSSAAERLSSELFGPQWIQHIPRHHTYKLTACAMGKFEAHRIQEFVIRNYIAGVQHFYLYDNSNEELVDEQWSVYLSPLIQAALVTVIPRLEVHVDGRMPWEDCFRDYGHLTEWMINIDMDETITMDPPGLSLLDVLDLFPDAQGVYLYWKLMSSGGHFHRPETYVGLKCSPPQLNDSRYVYYNERSSWGKTVFRPAKAVGFYLGHYTYFEDSSPTLNTLSEVVGGENKEDHITFAIAALNHDYLPSFEEFLFKRWRGHHVLSRDLDKVEKYPAMMFADVEHKCMVHAEPDAQGRALVDVVATMKRALPQVPSKLFLPLFGAILPREEPLMAFLVEHLINGYDLDREHYRATVDRSWAGQYLIENGELFHMFFVTYDTGAEGLQTRWLSRSSSDPPLLCHELDYSTCHFDAKEEAASAARASQKAFGTALPVLLREQAVYTQPLLAATRGRSAVGAAVVAVHGAVGEESVCVTVGGQVAVVVQVSQLFKRPYGSAMRDSASANDVLAYAVRLAAESAGVSSEFELAVLTLVTPPRRPVLFARRTVFVDLLQAHAAAAFYQSSFTSALVLTVGLENSAVRVYHASLSSGVAAVSGLPHPVLVVVYAVALVQADVLNSRARLHFRNARFLAEVDAWLAQAASMENAAPAAVAVEDFLSLFDSLSPGRSAHEISALLVTLFVKHTPTCAPPLSPQCLAAFAAVQARALPLWVSRWVARAVDGAAAAARACEGLVIAGDLLSLPFLLSGVWATLKGSKFESSYFVPVASRDVLSFGAAMAVSATDSPPTTLVATTHAQSPSSLGLPIADLQHLNSVRRPSRRVSGSDVAELLLKGATVAVLRGRCHTGVRPSASRVVLATQPRLLPSTGPAVLLHAQPSGPTAHYVPHPDHGYSLSLGASDSWLVSIVARLALQSQPLYATALVSTRSGSLALCNSVGEAIAAMDSANDFSHLVVDDILFSRA